MFDKCIKYLRGNADLVPNKVFEKQCFILSIKSIFDCNEWQYITDEWDKIDSAKKDEKIRKEQEKRRLKNGGMNNKNGKIKTDVKQTAIINTKKQVILDLLNVCRCDCVYFFFLHFKNVFEKRCVYTRVRYASVYATGVMRVIVL